MIPLSVAGDARACCPVGLNMLTHVLDFRFGQHALNNQEYLEIKQKLFVFRHRISLENCLLCVRLIRHGRSRRCMGPIHNLPRC